MASLETSNVIRERKTVWLTTREAGAYHLRDMAPSAGAASPSLL
jgi:hypothetical protein